MNCVTSIAQLKIQEAGDISSCVAKTVSAFCSAFHSGSNVLFFFCLLSASMAGTSLLMASLFLYRVLKDLRLSLRTWHNPVIPRAAFRSIL